MNLIKTSLAVSYLLLPILSFAEESQTGLAKKAQNPLTSMISLPIEENAYFDIGPDNETQHVINVQPVIPYQLNEDWNIISRAIIPITVQPKYLTRGSQQTGLGNTTFLPYFSPQPVDGLTWGVAPALMFPASRADIGSKEWGGGLSGAFILSTGKWVVGTVATQIWAPSGSESEQISMLSVQYFVNYNLDDGLYISTTPMNTYNSRAKSGERWTVPLGLGVGKVFKYGTQAINAKITGYKHVVKPTANSADWQIMLEITFLFPE